MPEYHYEAGKLGEAEEVFDVVLDCPAFSIPV
jgi:hypothetical protein